MRTIEKQMLNAIENKTDWSKSNTCVTNGYINSNIYLFGNHIGTYNHETGQFKTNIKTLLEWPSVTTMSRLRALGVDLTARKGKIYIDGQLIGSK